MKKRVIGALLLLILGAITIVAAWYLLPMYRDIQERTATDAGSVKGKITVALDNWIGYFILRSPEMKRRMRRVGWSLVCQDDRADYAGRMKRLKEGDVDFAVATVDSYILNAAGLGFPGAIIMVIDESKGGDAILARSGRVASLDALKGKKDIRIAYTPNSPSHHLAKATAYHFDVPELLPRPGNLRIETQGSEEALKKLLAGKTDVAILWEPDVSRALSHPDIKKIIGTKDTEKLIVDILVVNKRFSRTKPHLVELLLSNYFRVLKKYRDNSDLLLKDVISETGLSEKPAKSMLDGMKWISLTDNCERWFGIAPPGGSADEGLIRTIESTVEILLNSGDFKESPLPDDDPYRLTYSGYLEDLFVKGTTGFTTSTPGLVGKTSGSSLEAEFPPLDDGAWHRLKEFGTLKLDPVIFQHGATDLDLFAKEVIDRSIELVKHYPNFRILVKGHTGTRGDPEENRNLSQDRAEAVARHIHVTYNVHENRIRAIGLGGTEPLPRVKNESERSWQYRLPRVEIVLVREEY